MNTYEGMFILAESVDGDAVDPAVKRLQTQIQEQGGNVISSTRLGKRPFARPLKKQEAGQYVVMAFGLEGSKIDALKARLRLNEDLLRAQFIRMDAPEGAETEPEAEEKKASAKNG